VRIKSSIFTVALLLVFLTVGIKYLRIIACARAQSIYACETWHTAWA